MKSIRCLLGHHKFKQLEKAIDGFGEPAAQCERCDVTNGRARRLLVRINLFDWDNMLKEKTPLGVALSKVHSPDTMNYIMLQRKGLRMTHDIENPVDKPYLSYHDPEKDDVVFLQGERS